MDQESSTTPADSTCHAPGDDVLLSLAKELLAEGNKALERGDARGALEKYIAVREKRRAMQNQRLVMQMEGAAFNNLGLVYRYLGQYDNAVESLTSALTISRATGDRCMEGRNRNNLGSVYQCLGQYNKAIENHAAALAISQETGNQQLEGNSLGNLGLAYRSLGQYDKAIENHTAALAISQEIGDRRGEGRQLGNLGNVYASLGQYDKAIENYAAALAISRETGNRHGEGNSLGNLGLAYDSLGQYDKAIKNHSASLAIKQEIGNRQGEGRSLGNIGTAYRFLGEYNKAIEKLTAALTISQEIGDRQGEGARLGNLGAAYLSLGQCDKAIENYNAALAISREIGDQQGEADDLCGVGLFYEYINDYEKATQFLNDSMSVYNAIWSNIRNDMHRITYDDGDMQIAARSLQRVNSAQGKHEEALECAERARSRAFELLLAQQRVQEGKISDVSSLSMPSVVEIDISSMRELAVRQSSAIVIFSQVLNNHVLVWVLGSDASQPLFSTSIYFDKEAISELRLLVEGTRRLLKAPPRQGGSNPPATAANWTALAEVAVDDDEFYSAATMMVTLPDGSSPTPDQVRSAFAPPDQEENDESNETLRSDMQEEQRISDLLSRSFLQRCFELLIQPLLPVLEGETEVVFIPDHDLFGLPFGALLSGEGKHLIERFSIRVAPSVGTLIEFEHRINNAKLCDDWPSTLIVGNPDFKGWEEPLLLSHREAMRVKHAMELNSYNVTLLKDSDATKERVQSEMECKEIIHLATHGSKDGVLLSGTTKYDRTFSAAQVQELKLERTLSMAEVQELNLERARLVVLSACDTFKGELRADGVIGITRAFVAAGATTLISTLWKVGNISTQVFMSRFYHWLFAGEKGEVNVSRSLQNAAVSMIRDGFKVYEWAPFVIFGLSSTFAPPVTLESDKEKPLVVDMKYLLGLCELFSEQLLGDAMNWCKQSGIVGRAVEIVDQGKEEEFADSLALKPIKRKRLVAMLRLMAKETEGFS